MVTLRPVVERPAPVGGDWYLALSGRCGPDDVEVFLRAGTWATAGASPGELVATLVDRESLFVPGGLLAHDPATGVTVPPGCCAGLEGWPEWWWVLDGRPPDLGHDPAPVFESLGPVLRLWADADERDAHVDIPRADLPGLLDGVRRDLDEFTAPLRAWAGARGLDHRADDLVAAYRRSFAP